MPDNLFGSAGPQQPNRPQAAAPWSAAGGTPQPRPAQPVPPSGGQGNDSSPPGSGPKPMTLKHYIVLAAVAVPVIAFIVTMAVMQNRKRAGEQTQFGAEMENYLAPTVAAAPGAPLPAAGKMVAINADERALDYFQESLPTELRAAGPADVQTVVQLRYTDEEVGKYLKGGRALKGTVNVTVVDKSTHVVIGTKSFVGADPPLVTAGSGSDDVRGKLPFAEIKDYLLQLKKS